jgi:hypothetical protein
LLHVIDARDTRYKQLASEQRDRPVAVSELLAIQDYQFDGRINFLPGISAKSLTFSSITAVRHIAVSLRCRAQHSISSKTTASCATRFTCPGNFHKHLPSQHSVMPRIEFLLPFLNNEIIDWTNGVIEAYDLRFRKIAHFE